MTQGSQHNLPATPARAARAAAQLPAEGAEGEREQSSAVGRSKVCADGGRCERAAEQLSRPDASRCGSACYPSPSPLVDEALRPACARQRVATTLARRSGEHVTRTGSGGGAGARVAAIATAQQRRGGAYRALCSAGAAGHEKRAEPAQQRRTTAAAAERLHRRTRRREVPHAYSGGSRGTDADAGKHGALAVDRARRGMCSRASTQRVLRAACGVRRGGGTHDCEFTSYIMTPDGCTETRAELSARLSRAAAAADVSAQPPRASACR